MALEAIIEKAPVVFQHLHGVVCVFKPAFMSLNTAKRMLQTALANELNQMECREPKPYVEITGDTTKPLHVTVRENYADNPLLVGPRYMPDDIKCNFLSLLGYKASGVLVFGIGKGRKKMTWLRHANPLRVYHVTGKFGELRSDRYSTGKLLYNCHYDFLTKDSLDRFVATFQANHQKRMFELTGVPLSSQVAYELAAAGPIRPTIRKEPIVYGIKCIDFKLPYFILEISIVNENEDFLMNVVVEVADRMKNMAHCTSLICVRNAYFTIQNALLMKHWTLENVLNNMNQCNKILKEYKSISPHFEEIEDEEEDS